MPVLKGISTVAEARSALGAAELEEADPIWVVGDGGRYVGAVPLLALLSAQDDSRLDSILRKDWPVVPDEMDQERAADLARRAGFSEVGVVDAAGTFLGALPATTLLDVIWREHVEDVQRLSGVVHETEIARQALQGRLLARLVRRLPWLIVGMIGSMVAALVMSGFEGTLQARVEIAFFVPAIVYLADAIGTQTEAAAVRGLSLNHLPPLRTLFNESIEGVLIGAVLGTLALPLAWTIFGEPLLGIGLALSLLAAGAAAAALGFAMPWLFWRFGFDPAYGAGPVGTIIQDVLSLLIYFTVMIWLITL
ncbi:MAG TPA: magnesium transporter [Alphaproteobacteria bacterium]|nr:magnesium transporter [Alphaproteobacteria bacterium]